VNNVGIHAKNCPTDTTVVKLTESKVQRFVALPGLLNVRCPCQEFGTQTLVSWESWTTCNAVGVVLDVLL